MRRVAWWASVARWAALAGAGLLWWAPSLAIAVGALLLDRVRFKLTTARIDLLRALGRREAARRTCEAALQRCERRRRALAGRMGPK